MSSEHSPARQRLPLSRVDRRSKEEPPPDRLLYTREQVAAMLGGVSIATVRRLEQEGRLKPIRLSRSPTAQVFHKASDVDALIEGAADA